MVTKLIKSIHLARALSLQICLLSLMFCVSCSSASVQSSASNVPETDKTTRLSSSKSEPNRIDSILGKLNEHTQNLKTYQCQIEYRYVQPSVFDAQTLRKGVLYFQKNDKISKLRINFQTLQQDEEPERKYSEQYIIVDGTTLPDTNGKYKGLWLVQLDYELKKPKFIQITYEQEPNKPVDVFDLVGQRLPMIGFTKTDKLKEQFDISISEKNTELIQLQLKVKPNSIYKDDYAQIDCSIDEKLNLPVEIKAKSTEPEGESLENKDVYEIKFLKAQINKDIDKKVFDFQIPKDFDKPDIYPLDN